jgi:catechol 2,3-dioxygenase-like lactoylglutathione lyase family enzyme
MTLVLAEPRLNAGIVANDRAEALAFWHELLGFPIAGEVSFPGLTIIRLMVGESVLRICVPDKAAALAHAGDLSEETGLRYLTLAVRNLDEIVAAAAAKGYPVLAQPKVLRPGLRVAMISDGRGVSIEFQEMVAA